MKAFDKLAALSPVTWICLAIIGVLAALVYINAQPEKIEICFEDGSCKLMDARELLWWMQ